MNASTTAMANVRYALACRYHALESSAIVIDKLKHIGHLKNTEPGAVATALNYQGDCDTNQNECFDYSDRKCPICFSLSLSCAGVFCDSHRQAKAYRTPTEPGAVATALNYQGQLRYEPK